ncbi:MAG TPA: fructosamine kinase family protein [Gammaproteobacteria bacterium]|nr:fructosamine kinase family protein [Gammaproteobacteria bacterium]
MGSTGWQTRVEERLRETGRLPGPVVWRALGQGVGGARWRLTAGDESWFAKSGDGAVLAAEADGLEALATTATLRVPRVEALDGGDEGFLIAEWLPLTGRGGGVGARLGEALAGLHLTPAAGYGWPRHNFIGATPQFNTPAADWVGFFREQRLLFQLRLAAENGYRGRLQEQGAALAADLPGLFVGYTPKASLLHGDLWGGNWGALADGGPAVFDPAVYRGDREADIAMTELFGGFDREFYAAYRAHAPLEPGYDVRRDLYNLYHVLNHLNLFGEGYLGQAEGLVQRLLSELR